MPNHPSDSTVVNRAERAVNKYRVIRDPSVLFSSGAEFPASDVEVTPGKDGYEPGYLPTGIVMEKICRGQSTGRYRFNGERLVKCE